jgi:hypothetical protein
MSQPGDIITQNKQHTKDRSLMTFEF